MKPLNILQKRIVMVIALVGAFCLLWILVLQNQNKPNPHAAISHKQEQAEQAVEYGRPIRLIIPKISVDAPVKPMGLTSKGDMRAPTKPQDTGWYKFGARPGEIGSAVVAGHYGRWNNRVNSVFNKLKALAKGDTIYVKDAKSVTTAFVVRESRIYAPNDTAEEVFNSSDEKAHLNLITCQGKWDKAKRTYSHRLVVFTDKSDM